MKKLLFIAAAMTASFTGKAQITLEHTFNNIRGYQTVLFTANGTKHVTNDTGTNTVKLYNTDYTLWKTIPISIPSGSALYTLNYVSDKLFNDDNSIELFYSYYRTTPTVEYRAFIINESGGVIKDFGLNSFYGNVIYIEGNHKLVVSSIGYKSEVYSLPGSLPCGHCGSVGIPKVSGPTGGGSVAAAAVPNPGSDEVRISYSLPLGVNSGVLVLSGVDGKVINSYPVSNRDSELKVNISTLPGGLYIYTLHAEGMMPATGKIVK
jgi:hypothetical protein